MRSIRTHGLIHASLVGALSTRSSAPSLPRPMMLRTKASPMLPIVRVLATVSFAATRLRVRPAARTFWYSADLPSALHEVPPARVLPLAEAACVARGQEDRQPVDEELQLLRRDALPGHRLEEVLRGVLGRRRARERVRPDAERASVGPAVGTQELAALRGHHVVVHAVRVPLERGCAASSPERGGRSRERSGIRARREAACGRPPPCGARESNAPCRPAPCARRRGRRSHARPARARWRGRPSRRPAPRPSAPRRLRFAIAGVAPASETTAPAVAASPSSSRRVRSLIGEAYTRQLASAAELPDLFAECPVTDRAAAVPFYERLSSPAVTGSPSSSRTSTRRSPRSAPAASSRATPRPTPTACARPPSATPTATRSASAARRPTSGERGIRTPERRLRRYTISNRARSAAPAPLRATRQSKT